MIAKIVNEINKENMGKYIQAQRKEIYSNSKSKLKED